MSITDEQKEAIKQQAHNCCEYCRVEGDNRASTYQVDHIIARKHGGDDAEDNLCLACIQCNQYKGSNVAAIDPETDKAAKLYHPRKQNWYDHFELKNDAEIVGLTPEGRVTVNVLRLNLASRIATRQALIALGEYPCE